MGNFRESSWGIGGEVPGEFGERSWRTLSKVPLGLCPKFLRDFEQSGWGTLAKVPDGLSVKFLENFGPSPRGTLGEVPGGL